MNNTSGIAFVAVLLTAASARAQSFEGRNSAMGGAGVASSRYLSAPLANPALLTLFREDDTWGLIAPTLGVQIADPDKLVEEIDDFQDAVDGLEAAIAASSPDAVARANDVTRRLLALDGRAVTGAAGLNFVVALPADTFALALVARTYLDVRATPMIDPADVARITSPTFNSATLTSEARLLGASISDVGISIATSFDLGGAKLSIGVTPKYQRVDTYNYSVNVDNFDSDNFDDAQFRNDDSHFSADFGAALSLAEGMVTVGAMVRNLVPDDFRTVTTNGQSFSFEVGTIATLGVALKTESITLTAEVDLTETERFANIRDNSRFVRAGVEFDIADWVQLRGGGQFDTEDTVEDMFTAGVGFSPFDVFHLDIAGMISEGNTYGAVLQTSFTF